MTLHDDQLLSEIGSALSVEHGPAFGAGVHARIRRSRQRRFTAGGALALAATVALAVWMSRPEPPVPSEPETVVASKPIAPLGAALTAPAVPGPPATVASVVRPVSRVRAVPAVANVVTAPAAPLQHATSLVVVTNQGAVLEEMWRAARGRPVQEVTAEKIVVADTPPAPIVIEPVQVAPVVISDRAPVPAAGVVPIIRRAFAAAETR